MASIAEAINAINELKATGLITDYAVTGAMATLFWTEAIPTFDLDVLVLLPATPGATLLDLGSIYAWAAQRGYALEGEHIKIGGVPVQFVSAGPLGEEAVRHAKTLKILGVPVQVATPEFLIAMALDGSARSGKRLERAKMLLESGLADTTVLDDIMTRYQLKW